MHPSGPHRDPTIGHLVTENERLSTKNALLRAALWVTLALGVTFGAAMAFAVTLQAFLPAYLGLSARVAELEDHPQIIVIERVEIYVPSDPWEAVDGSV